MNVQRTRSRRQDGYSLVELLVVVAIIGTFSLITIPSFVSFYRTSKMRTAMRQFTADIRLARQHAITQSRRTALTFSTGVAPAGYARGQYEVWEREADGTWRRMKLRTLPPEAADPIYFERTGFANATEAGGTNVAGDTRPDLVFLPNGTVANLPNSDATLVLKTDYPIRKPKITLTFRASGNFSSVEE